MGKVIHLDKQESGGGVSGLWKFTATNYADLLTKVGMVEGDLAIVYNSQGVWPINRRLKGVYMYQSGAWEYANQELQDLLIASEGKVKVSISDTTLGYLSDKIGISSDITSFIDSPPSFDQKLLLNLLALNKPFIPSPARDPLPTDDDSITSNHRVGQVWYNSSNNRFWICQSLSIGNAIWMPLIDNLRFKAFNNVSQDVNTLGAGTDITFSSDTISEPNFLNISHVANTSDITIGVDGRYKISYNISHELISGQRKNIGSTININGIPNWEFDSSQYVRNSANPWGSNRAESEVDLNGGDIITLNAFRLGDAGQEDTFTPGTYIDIQLIKRN